MPGHMPRRRADHIAYRRATDLRDCFRLGLATACIAGGVAMLILVFAQSPDAHADAGSLITPMQVDFTRLDGSNPRCAPVVVEAAALGETRPFADSSYFESDHFIGGGSQSNTT